MGALPPIVQTEEFRLLEGLRLNPRRSFSGHTRGERLTKRKGISIEFADYRDYAEGDDLRHLDWNVLARLESSVIRTYQDEEDLAVYTILDTSASMDFGEPTKFAAAKRVCCALGYIALASYDAVFPVALGSRSEWSRALRGRSSYRRLAQWVEGLKPVSTQGLAASLIEFARRDIRPGVALIVSDGLDPGIGKALMALAGRKFEPLFVQILSDVEVDPDIEGDLRLVDSESGATVEVTANGAAVKEYQKRLANHNQMLAEAVRRSGGRYLSVSSRFDLKELVGRDLRREGWIAS